MTRTTRTLPERASCPTGGQSGRTGHPPYRGVRSVRTAGHLVSCPSNGDRKSVVILGIDPGLRATGWGAIGVDRSQLSLIGMGTITSVASDHLGMRLDAIRRGLDEVLARVEPDEAIVEDVFVNANGRSSLKLGHARGVAMLAPAARGIPVAEYAATAVKKAVTGSGRADKHQIRHMVKLLLPGAVRGSEHAFDALAIAICHASHRRVARNISSQSRGLVRLVKNG